MNYCHAKLFQYITSFISDEHLRTSIHIRTFPYKYFTCTNIFLTNICATNIQPYEFLPLRLFSHDVLLTWRTLYPMYIILTYFRQTNFIPRIIAFSIGTCVWNPAGAALRDSLQRHNKPTATPQHLRQCFALLLAHHHRPAPPAALADSSSCRHAAQHNDRPHQCSPCVYLAAKQVRDIKRGLWSRYPGCVVCAISVLPEGR